MFPAVLPSGGSIATFRSGIFFLIQIYKLALVLPLRPYPYLSLLCLSMSWESTFVGQPLSLFFSQILFVWLIISVSYWHLDLVVPFFLSILFVDLAIQFFLSRALSPWSSSTLFVDLAIQFFLSMALCLLGLLRSFSDNFVCCLLLLDQGHSLMMLSSISSSHHLIPLLVIYGSASHYLFGLARRTWFHSMTILSVIFFHVINFSSWNLIQMQCYCIRLTFEAGGNTLFVES
jgi:hypothetical protein